MNYIKKKYFWRNTQGYKSVYGKTWDESEIEYYNFIKSFKDNGYHQIAINTEMMINLISLVAKDRCLSVLKIDMLEEDEELNDELEAIIASTKSNRGLYITLIDTLKELVEDSSLEIKRLNLNYSSNGICESFYIQINGLYGVSESDTELEKVVTNYIEEYMNK